jgi:uncharacterized protein YydD (DUF2326 family)
MLSVLEFELFIIVTDNIEVFLKNARVLFPLQISRFLEHLLFFYLTAALMKGGLLTPSLRQLF